MEVKTKDVENKNKEITKIKKQLCEKTTALETANAEIIELKTKDVALFDSLGHMNKLVKEENTNGKNKENRNNPIVIGDNENETELKERIQERENTNKNFNTQHQMENRKVNRICGFFVRQQCRYGDSCRYIHPTSQRPYEEKRPKTLLCLDFQRNRCNRRECNFLHIRQIQTICREYQRGECKYGNCCRFLQINENEDRSDRQDIHQNKWKRETDNNNKETADKIELMYGKMQRQMEENKNEFDELRKYIHEMRNYSSQPKVPENQDVAVNPAWNTPIISTENQQWVPNQWPNRENGNVTYVYGQTCASPGVYNRSF